MLWTVVMEIQKLDYVYYAALTLAALHGNAAAPEQDEWREAADGAPGETARIGQQLRIELSPANTPWCRRRSPASKAGTPTPCAFMKRRFNWRAQYGLVEDEGVAHELAAEFYRDPPGHDLRARPPGNRA